jgi:voltage-gated potassium channel
MSEHPEADVQSRYRRWRVVLQLERWLEPVMVFLGFVWLSLLIAEFGWGLRAWMTQLSNVIWIIFIADFLLRFSVAPRKLLYLRKSWLTLIALALPALRIFRLFRALRLIRFTRSLRLVRLITSFNRGLKALGKTMRRRGVGYVALLTTLVVFVGGAGMYTFESGPGGQGFSGYLEAVWWTAMIVTTMGSGDWPQTPEGRLLSLILSAYAVGVFGYLAGSLASFFIDQDASTPSSDVPSEQSLRDLRTEIAALREEIRSLKERK